MITVAIISDTHSSLDKQIIDLIKQCDYAVHAGDICGSHILDLMEPKTGKVLAVAGNNDVHCHDMNQLPDTLSLDLPNGVLSVEHGHLHGMATPCHASLRKAHAHSKVVVYGHTHKMVIDKSATPWVINPGASGQVRTNGGPSCLVLSVNDTTWNIDEYRFQEEAV